MTNHFSRDVTHGLYTSSAYPRENIVDTARVDRSVVAAALRRMSSTLGGPNS